MVRARLIRKLRSSGFTSFEQYLRYVEKDSSRRELFKMVDLLTTNKTGFFREPQHLEYLSRKVLPSLMEKGGRIRIWSAGCSSGEEPFSIAILLREEIPGIERMDVRVLATDISRRMLEIARKAEYQQEALKDVPPKLLRKYFTCVDSGFRRVFRVNEEIRSMVSLAWLNLMGNWPMKGPFHIIFCRNVMIYFDKPTQQRLVQRFWNLLEPGGCLMVGHAESLTTISHRFRYMQPAVYLK
jgi:chemotaxis protein methyltransferase CheR